MWKVLSLNRLLLCFIKHAKYVLTRSINNGLNIRDVFFIENDFDAFRWITNKLLQFLANLATNVGCQIFKRNLDNKVQNGHIFKIRLCAVTFIL